MHTLVKAKNRISKSVICLLWAKLQHHELLVMDGTRCLCGLIVVSNIYEAVIHAEKNAVVGRENGD